MLLYKQQLLSISV